MHVSIFVRGEIKAEKNDNLFCTYALMLLVHLANAGVPPELFLACHPSSELWSAHFAAHLRKIHHASMANPPVAGC